MPSTDIGRVSVLVVDDSVVVRRLVTDAIEGDPAIRVVGTAANGKIALAKIAQLAPDLVTLDIEMPVMDGLTTLREIRRTHPKLPVIMFSTLTVAGGRATLDALEAGASDYVTKPSNSGSIGASLHSVRDQLVPRIHALCGTRRPAPSATRVPAAPPRRSAPVDVVAIGCSTGGPQALAGVVGRLPADLPVPVVVVQHMPPTFTRLFAERLSRTSAVTVAEAGPDQPLRPGTVYLAPGNRHLEVVRQGGVVRTRLHDGPPENYCRPAVDVLFRSVARAYGAAALGVVLTGMGQDGRGGCEHLRAAGAPVVVQDEATSVVWGMPGAVAAAGLADAILPIDRIPAAVLEHVAVGRAQLQTTAGAR